MVEYPDILADYLSKNPSVLEIIRSRCRGENHRLRLPGCGDPIQPFYAVPVELVPPGKVRGKFRRQLANLAAGRTLFDRAVPTQDGGVIAARIRMNLLWEVIGAVRFGHSGHAYVLTPDGTVIAHKTHEVVMAYTSLAGRPELTAIVEESDNYLWRGNYVNFQGERVQGVAQMIPGLNWILLTELSRSEAVATSRQALLFLLFAVATFGLFTMATIFTSMKQMVLNPVDALRTASERIGNGDFAHRVTVQRTDEIGEVAHAFNEMAAGLTKRDTVIVAKTAALATEIEEHKKTQHELKQLNLTLEQRVFERTRELELLTTDLKRSNKELQEFAYVASHDLQEPLRKVRAFGDRLVERYGQVLDARGQDYVARDASQCNAPCRR